MDFEPPSCIPYEPALIDEFWAQLGSTDPVEPLPQHPEDISDQNFALDSQLLNPPLYCNPETTYQGIWKVDTEIPPRDAISSIWEDESWTNMFRDPRPCPQPPIYDDPESGGLGNTEMMQEKTRKHKEVRRLKIDPDKKRILDDAFRHDPYPATSTRELLGGVVGMAERQVRGWFNNARARRPRKSPEPPSQLTKVNLDQLSQRLKRSKESLSSLQRYLEQPIEPGIEDVNTFLGLFLPSSLSGLGTNAALLTNLYEESRTPSLISAGHSASSKGSLQTVASHISGATFRSFASRGSRQGRRKFPYQSHKNAEKQAMFACVFCQKPCRTLYEWRRHEESVHVAPIEFVCEKLGFGMDIDGRCGYCGDDADNRNIIAHELHVRQKHQCSSSEKEEAERTFSRKDHLVQHIRLAHNAPHFSMGDQNQVQGPGWKKRIRQLDAQDDAVFCGFCGNRSEDWARRVNHVAGHFKAGQDISDWDWNHGSDYSIALLEQKKDLTSFIRNDDDDPHNFLMDD